MPLSPETMERPFTVFPNDTDELAGALYQECARESLYTPGFTVGCLAMAEGFGVETDVQTAETWKRTAMAMNILDPFLDDSDDREEANALYQAGLQHVLGEGPQPTLPDWADPLLEPAIQLLDNAVTELPEERKVRLVRCGQRVGEISLEKAAATDVKSYITLLREEGRLTGQLFGESASPAVYDQHTYGSFKVWLQDFMELGTLGDSWNDLADDGEAGLTGVKPSLLSQLRMCGAVAKTFSRIVRHKEARKALVGTVLPLRTSVKVARELATSTD